MAKKYTYFFSKQKTEVPDVENIKFVLGGKGASLVQMTKLGVPVPPGFVISIDACDYFYKNDRKYPEGLMDTIDENIKELEEITGKKFGSKVNPLLVSVRSGAAVSMPGMMDTVLNLGLNEDSIEGLIKQSGNERFAWDSYRRFIQMYGNVVMGMEHSHFENILDEVKGKKGVQNDVDLDVDDLKEVVKKYKALYKKEIGEEFPDDPKKQLKNGIDAVFKSWNNPRAIAYRRINKIAPEVIGTAVNVQSMVFGNLGDNSGTGVAFTRNPSTGEKKYYGEYLMKAQGEDVVAGIRTPNHLEDMAEQLPDVYKELTAVFDLLEKHYKDMMDIEFTIENGELFILQSRQGKRTGMAAVKIAVDLVKEKMLTQKEAILRVEPQSLDQLLHPMIDPSAEKKEIAKGLPASPGAGCGQIVFTAEDAMEWAKDKKQVILVRLETSPEDIEGMNVAQGILTGRGGMTSHAAVVARGMGRCCVAGCSGVSINEDVKIVKLENGDILKEGDWITIDGSNGVVYEGKVPTVEPSISGDFAKLMSWADKARKLEVRTNADTPKDAKVAREFGAEGIGLTRTEHMFFKEDRIFAVRQMILSDTKEQRVKALAKIEKMQQSDFEGIFKEMEGLPVTIRLLDPPLHEFLPHEDDELRELAGEMGVEFEELRAKRDSLAEFNPMLGFRGCRLGMVYPEITEMQVRAIINAAIAVAKKGLKVEPEIEVPFVSHVKELAFLKDVITNTAEECLSKSKTKVEYKVAAMLELPRSCVITEQLAEYVQLFSFGTNDLTQTTFGYSRDDAGKFIGKYIENGILTEDPFQTLDTEGVGELMKMALKKAKSVNKKIKLGICGEHGGEPKSIEFCHKIGMDFVSCSPYRVPIARLAAAQAAVKPKK
ncbi:pyruvate, phosphate dikinase [bacterium]|nr:pyruvate, phosphate dikinase [bacterium]